MVKRLINEKTREQLKNIENIRGKSADQLTQEEINKLTIYLATKEGILK